MKLNSLQIIALVVAAITILKLVFFMFGRKDYLDSRVKSYVNKVNCNKWLYFSIYTSLSILALYFIRQYTDINGNPISYTEILAVMMFMAMLFNAVLIAANLISHLSLDKYNWGMIGTYSIIWLFIIFKSIQEIFNY